jgi:hypothetical protein
MRRPSIRSARRQHAAHNVNPFASSSALLRRLRRGTRSPLGRRQFTWWAVCVSAVLVSGGLLLGAHAPSARAVSSRQGMHGSSGTFALSASAGLPVRWNDPADHTAALLDEVPESITGVVVGVAGQPAQPTPTAQPKTPAQATSQTVLIGVYTFVFPSGAQVVTTFLPQDSAFTNILSAILAGGPFDRSMHTCARGELIPADSTAAAVAVMADVALHVARVSEQNVLLAYAGLDYGSDDRVCGTSTPRLRMLAGCNATTCTPPLPPTASVAQYDNAVVLASANKQWNAVYQLTSTAITAQYGPDDFAALMANQVSAQGQITAISPVVSGQIIRAASNGQDYFVVAQTVTLERNGKSSSRSITSYYLFEAGSWKFWFSL